MDGRAIRARSAISPPTYMPISRTAASCSGPEVEHGQRQADLVVPVALGAQRREPARQDGRDRLLRRGLGDAPGDPGDERIEPPAPAGGHRPERGQAIGDTDDRDVAGGIRFGDRAGHEDRGRAARRSRRRCGHGRPSAHRGGRRTAGPGVTSRESTAAPPDRAIGAGHEPSAGQGDQIVGGQGRSASVGRRERRVHVGHGVQSGMGRVHRSGSFSTIGRWRSRSGVLIALVAMRRKSSNDMTFISSWPTLRTVGRALLDPDGDDEVRPVDLAGDVADERVVEQVVLPALALRVPDLGRAGLAADEVARDDRPVVIEGHGHR